ncbi:MAG TPA: polysaccharide biosynthesis/export family protein [Kiritimatiellia bacterium]|mgnify:CR=1 FL=1|nr:polysaccharide biosynthesis/export family protein [Kiritimatiellia bacterium]
MPDRLREVLAAVERLEADVGREVPHESVVEIRAAAERTFSSRDVDVEKPDATLAGEWERERHELLATIADLAGQLEEALAERDRLTMEVEEAKQMVSALAQLKPAAVEPSEVASLDLQPAVVPSLSEPEQVESRGWFRRSRPGRERGAEEAAGVERERAPDALSEQDYVLRPGDQIDVQVFREPSFSGDFQINPEGAIRHPLLGSLTMAGMTVADAEARLITLLAADYLVNPRVVIRVTTARGHQFVLLGEVRSPGVYPLGVGESVTLLQAIANAGGFTELASPDRVRIVRRNNGETITMRVRVSDLLSGRGREEDIPLQPNDVITVPEILF